MFPSEWPGQTPLKFRTNRRHFQATPSAGELKHPLFHIQSKRHFPWTPSKQSEWRPCLKKVDQPPFPSTLRETGNLRRLVENITLVKPRLDRYSFPFSGEAKGTSLADILASQ